MDQSKHIDEPQAQNPYLLWESEVLGWGPDLDSKANIARTVAEYKNCDVYKKNTLIMENPGIIHVCKRRGQNPRANEKQIGQSKFSSGIPF